MHEASLMADLLRQICTVAQSHQACKVVRVSVKIGPWSHCSPEHLQAHFAYAARGTMAEGARLEVEVVAEMEGQQAQDVRLDHIEVED